MKYGDELDRIPSPGGLSRRQFLSAGGGRAARLAAGVLLPGAGKRLGGPTDGPGLEAEDPEPGES
jgi:hypothetical protein